MEKFRQPSTSRSVAIALLLLTNAATAQGQTTDAQTTSEQADRDDPGLAEIVVTANRRAQNLQDVSIAIAAFTEERIADLDIESGIDIAKLTPGVFVSNAGAGQSLQYSIRGVTQADFSDIFEGPIAVYVDDTYIPFLQGQVFATFDLERVEVLKGPQGTLFGKNATGGLVHYIPKKPSQETDGFIDLQYGRFNSVRTEAALGGSLTETISARVSVLLDRNDAFVDNIYPFGHPVFFPAIPPEAPFGQDLGKQKTLIGRLQLLGQFGELRVRLSGTASGVNFGSSPYTSRAVTPVFNQFGQHVNTILNPPAVPSGLGAISPPSVFDTAADFARSDGNFSDAYDLSAHIEYDLGSMTLAAVSSYKKFKKSIALDIDGGPVNFTGAAVKNTADSFSQELRLTGEIGGAKISSGLFYISSEGIGKSGFLAASNSLLAGAFGPGLGASGLDLINTARFKNTDYSAYAQLDVPVGEKITFVIGGRVIRNEQEFDFISQGYQNVDDFKVDTGVVIIPNFQPPFSDKRHKTLWAARAVVEYRPSDNALLYAGYNRGVKSGAYNGKFPDFTPPLTPDEITYDAETLHAYEGGFKLTLLGRKVTLNGATYYYKYNNYQVFQLSNASGIVFNKDAETYGFEISTDFVLGDSIRGAFGYAYTHATIKDLATAPAVLNVAPAIFDDTRPAFSPRHQLSGNVVYTAPTVIFGGKIDFRLVGSYISDFFDNPRNFDAQRQKGYALFDAGVRWQSDTKWQLAFDVRNLFNKDFVETAFDTATICGCSQTHYGKPRWWTVSVRKDF